MVSTLQTRPAEGALNRRAPPSRSWGPGRADKSVNNPQQSALETPETDGKNVGFRPVLAESEKIRESPCRHNLLCNARHRSPIGGVFVTDRFRNRLVKFPTRKGAGVGIGSRPGSHPPAPDRFHPQRHDRRYVAIVFSPCRPPAPKRASEWFDATLPQLWRAPEIGCAARVQ